MSLTGEYDKKYFKASRGFQSNPMRIADFIDKIMVLRPTHVLDVGCGIGYLTNALNAVDIPTIGVDNAEALKQFWGDKLYFEFADAKKLPFKDKSFDLVISSDFFEHVPEADIDTVYGEMKRVGNRVAASIAYEDRLTNGQARYHVTNKSKEWGMEKLLGIIVL